MYKYVYILQRPKLIKSIDFERLGYAKCCFHLEFYYERSTLHQELNTLVTIFIILLY